MYEDYKEGLISDSDYVKYKSDYNDQIRQAEERLEWAAEQRLFYAKQYHVDEDWEAVVEKYCHKRKLTKEMVEAFVDYVSIFEDGRIEVHLIYDDHLTRLEGVKTRKEEADVNNSDLFETIK